MDSFQEFDFSTGEFKDLDNKNIVPLHGHSITGYADKLWIFGGNSTNTVSNGLFEYDFKNKSWKKLDIKGQKLESLAHTHFFFNEFNLFIHGGLNTVLQESKATFIVNLFTNNCEKIDYLNPSGSSKSLQVLKLNESHVLLIQSDGNVYHLNNMDQKWDNIGVTTGLQNKSFGVINYKRNFLYLFGTNDSKINLYICRTKMATGVRDFFLNPELSDITLKVQDYKIPAHKAFLSQAKFFQKDLESTMEISLDPQNFLKALRFIYLDTLKLKGDDLYSMVKMARDLEFEALEIHCVNQIGDLPPLEVLSLLENSEKSIKDEKKERFYRHDYLKNLCIQNYQQNQEKYDSKEIYQRIKNLDKDLRIELLVSAEISSELFDELDRLENLRIHLQKYGKYHDAFIVSSESQFPVHKLFFYFNDKIMSLLKDDQLFYFQENPESVRVFSKWIYHPEYDTKKFTNIINRYNISFEGGGSSFRASKILTHEMKKALMKWSNEKSWELIFQGSKDGFTGKEFHNKCNDKGSTISVILTENGNIFGGYNPSPWKNTTAYDFNKDAFLFSLKRNNKVEPVQLTMSGIYHSNTYGAYNNPNYLCTFGGGHDLHIANGCNNGTGSYSNLGYSFATTNIVYGQNEAKNYLAGSYNFKVKEIEVYCLKKNK